MKKSGEEGQWDKGENNSRMTSGKKTGRKLKRIKARTRLSKHIKLGSFHFDSPFFFFSNKNSRLPLYWDWLCVIIERRRKKDEAEQDDPSAGCQEKSRTIINTLKTLQQMCSGWRRGWGEMFQSFPSEANLGQCVKIRLHAEVRGNTSQAQFCRTSSTWHESMCLSLLTRGSIRTYAMAAADSPLMGKVQSVRSRAECLILAGGEWGAKVGGVGVVYK